MGMLTDTVKQYLRIKEYKTKILPSMQFESAPLQNL